MSEPPSSYFARVVVPLGVRQDLADRRGHGALVAEHAALDLAARDELLDERLLVVPVGELERVGELLGPVHLADADARAEIGRLHEDRPAERLADARDDSRVERVVGAVAQHEGARDGYARVAQHRLAERLVHARRRAEHAGADVGRPSVSSRPWIVPSSPNGPCSTGKTTSISPAPAPFAPTSAPPPAPGTSEVPPPRRELGRGHAARRRPRARPAPSTACQPPSRVDQQRAPRRSGRDRALRSPSAPRPARSRARTSGRPRRRRCAGDGSRRRRRRRDRLVELPDDSMTTNGFVFVPSMFWSCTTPSWPGVADRRDRWSA